MRQKLFLSTAALLAGIAVASAQGTPGGGKGPGTTAGQERQPSTQGRSRQVQQGEHQQSAPQQGRAGQLQHNVPSERREQTTGQAMPGSRELNRQPSQTEGEATHREQGQVQSPRQPQPAEGQPAGGGNVALSSEQRTRIRESVLVGSNVPRADNINISLRERSLPPACESWKFPRRSLQSIRNGAAMNISSCVKHCDRRSQS